MNQIVRATVAGNLILHDLPANALERIALRLRIKNDKYVRAIRMGRHPGIEPEWIESAIEMPDGSTHVPRGAVDLVREQLARCDLDIAFDDRRSKGSPAGLDAGACAALLAKMRPYQKDGIAALVAQRQGTIVLPCGCGKSLLGVGAAATLNVTTLIIIHTSDLASQWAEDIVESFGFAPGMIGDGRCEPNAPIVIGIDDSLVPYLERNPTYGERFGLVIVDEAHHTPSKTFLRGLACLPAHWRVGLTATPFREDGLTEIMNWSFGKRLLERETQEMIKLGYLMNAEIEIVNTGWRWAWDGDPESPKRIASMEQDLAEDLSRNAGIADRVCAEARAGQTLLVLANRKEMVRELAEMIGGRGVECAGVTSSTSKKKRAAAMAAFKDGRLPVMIATSLADEGLNVPRLSRVVLAFPQKAKGGTTQRLGRLLRLYDKKPMLIDYVDEHVATLERRAAERARVYRSSLL